MKASKWICLIKNNFSIKMKLTKSQAFFFIRLKYILNHHQSVIVLSRKHDGTDFLLCIFSNSFCFYLNSLIILFYFFFSEYHATETSKQKTDSRFSNSKNFYDFLLFYSLVNCQSTKILSWATISISTAVNHK